MVRVKTEAEVKMQEKNKKHTDPGIRASQLNNISFFNSAIDLMVMCEVVSAAGIMPAPASSIIKNRAEQTEYEPILIIPPV